MLAVRPPPQREINETVSTCENDAPARMPNPCRGVELNICEKTTGAEVGCHCGAHRHTSTTARTTDPRAAMLKEGPRHGILTCESKDP